MARRILPLLEPIHQTLESFFQVRLPQKSHVLLDPNLPLFNGFNTVIPDNLSVLYLTPPNEFFFLHQLGPDWLYQLLLHELAHNVHLNRRKGVFGVLRNIFGSEIAAFAKNPDGWNKEGIATYLESLFSRRESGRLNHGRFHTIAAYEVTLDQLPPIYDVNHSPGHWLLDHTYYLYGSLFIRYLDERFGREKLRDFLKRSTSIFPLFKDIPFKRIYGAWPPKIWNEWIAEMKRESAFRKFIYSPESPSKETALKGEKLEVLALSTPRPYFIEDGHLYLLQKNRSHPLKFVEMDLDKQSARSKKRFYARTQNPRLVGIDEEGNALYLAGEQKTEIMRSRDLYQWNRRRFKKMTRHGDVVFARHARKAKKTWVVGYRHGQYKIKLVHDSGRLIWQGALPDKLIYLSDLAVNEEGNVLLVHGYDERKKERVLFQESSSPINRLENRQPWREIELPPGHKDHFEFAGKRNFTFTMVDERGIDQIWHYRKDQLEQLTYSDFGAWQGKLRDKWLYFYVLSPYGFQLMREDLSRVIALPTEKKFSHPGVKSNPIRAQPLRWEDFQQRRTRLLASAYPHSWWPIINITSDGSRDVLRSTWLFGVFFRGRNLQETFFYQFLFDYVLRGNFLMQATLSYRFSWLTYQSSYVYLGDGDSSRDSHLWNNAFIFNRGAPFVRSGQFYLNYLTRFSEGDWDNEVSTGLIGIGATKVRRFSFFKEGWLYFVGGGTAKPWLASKRDVAWTQLDIHYYQPIYKELGTHFRLAWGHAWGIDAPTLFSIRSVASLERYRFEYFSDDLDQIFSTKRLPLRIGPKTQSFGRGGLLGIDFFFPLLNYYSVTRFFPWFMFQNITGDLFYEWFLSTQETSLNQYAYEHGLGLALDFRFNDRPLIKSNLGISFNFNRKEGFLFINLVIRS